MSQRANPVWGELEMPTNWRGSVGSWSISSLLPSLSCRIMLLAPDSCIRLAVIGNGKGAQQKWEKANDHMRWKKAWGKPAVVTGTQRTWLFTRIFFLLKNVLENKNACCKMKLRTTCVLLMSVLCMAVTGGRCDVWTVVVSLNIKWCALVANN